MAMNKSESMDSAVLTTNGDVQKDASVSCVVLSNIYAEYRVRLE